ncbi:MAG: hypothetical protein JEZ02_01715 [Desulfatibacillum sp.]|nr:hypothetical protein [Desulfatibacillum sp.]
MKSGFLYQYYYLWSVALLIPAWAVIFFKKRRTWEEMIYIGILCGAGAMFFDRYVSFRDYWRPPTISDIYNFESFLYGFFFGGISAKIYEFVSKTEYVPTSGPNPLFAMGMIILNSMVFVTMVLLFRLNSVENFVCMLLSTSVLFLMVRPALFKVCLGSGVIMVGLNMCWYGIILSIYPDVFKDIWLPSKQEGMTIFNVPVMEHWFIFAVGCSGSLFYKAVSKTKQERSTLSVHSNNNAPVLTWKSLSSGIKEAGVPLTILFIVIARMVLFGKAPINLGKILHLFH